MQRVEERWKGGGKEKEISKRQEGGPALGVGGGAAPKKRIKEGKKRKGLQRG